MPPAVVHCELFWVNTSSPRQNQSPDAKTHQGFFITSSRINLSRSPFPNRPAEVKSSISFKTNYFTLLNENLSLVLSVTLPAFIPFLQLFFSIPPEYFPEYKQFPPDDCGLAPPACCYRQWDDNGQILLPINAWDRCLAQ